MEESTRLNKYIAQCGVCSRREADRLIEAGKVTINGKTASMGDQVRPGDEVICAGTRLEDRNEKVVLAYYKPIGITCTEKDRFADKTLQAYPKNSNYIFDHWEVGEGKMFEGRIVEPVSYATVSNSNPINVPVKQFDREYNYKFYKAVFVEKDNANGVYTFACDDPPFNSYFAQMIYIF